MKKIEMDKLGLYMLYQALNLPQVSDHVVFNLQHALQLAVGARNAQGPLPVLRRLLLQLAEREPRLCPGL